MTMGKMTVKDLMTLLEQQDPNEEIFVSCQGYNNYDPQRKTYRDDDGTYLLKKDGKLFLADTCYVELY